METETPSITAKWQALQAFAQGLLNLAIEAGWRWDEEEQRWIKPGTPEHEADHGAGCGSSAGDRLVDGEKGYLP